MKPRVLLIILGIAVFVIFGLFMFRHSLTPYVSFQAARSGQTVQVVGSLVKGSIRYDDTTHLLHFSLKEKEGEAILPVAYEGSRPSNFEDATSIVAIGSFTNKTFQAQKLLVKCPSKYQGTKGGTKRTYTGSSS